MFGIMYVRFSIDDHDQVWVVEFVSVFGLAQYKTYVSFVQSHKHTFIQIHTIAGIEPVHIHLLSLHCKKCASHERTEQMHI